jgi:hypothetical protein
LVNFITHETVHVLEAKGMGLGIKEVCYLGVNEGEFGGWTLIETNVENKIDTNKMELHANIVAYVVTWFVISLYAFGFFIMVDKQSFTNQETLNQNIAFS